MSMPDPTSTFSVADWLVLPVLPLSCALVIALLLSPSLRRRVGAELTLALLCMTIPLVIVYITAVLSGYLT
ncbi:hypothetical protein ABIA32_003307 [Streptacidiphilus sp. MAP12-20]|uniref:hypothetical protein n=1 Tax=Streptacidiphilus sp. MAP12-20 TaxID=3156299 RepID=UPI003513E8C6